MFNCRYCRSGFKNNNILSRHQKEAKYCLTLQQAGHVCKFCEKYFTTAFNLTRHLETCKHKINNDDKPQEIKVEVDNKLKEVDDKLKEFSTQLKEVENKNTFLYTQLVAANAQLSVYQSTDKKVETVNNIVVHNNNNNLFLGVTQEELLAKAKNYTVEHYNKGPAGLAQWTSENLFYDKEGNRIYTCLDTDRKKFAWIIGPKKKIIDLKAIKLRDMIRPVLQPIMEKFKKAEIAKVFETEDDDNGRQMNQINKAKEKYNLILDMGPEYFDYLVSKTT